jgi:voltage-gated potassium channel
VERRRRFPVLRLIRALVVAAVGLGVYLVIPLPREDAVSDALILVLALAAVVAVAGWAVQRAWLKEKIAERMRLLALVLYVAVIVFALAYVSISASDPASFTQPMDRVDALYFTATVLATVGFGDITAVTQPARLLVTFQMVFNVLVISTALGLIINAPRQAAETHG